MKKEEHRAKHSPIRYSNQSNTNASIKSYKVVFADSTDVEHDLTITENNNLFTLQIKFSSPLTFKNIESKGYSIQSKDLKELKSLAESYLSNFGVYNIKPI